MPLDPDGLGHRGHQRRHPHVETVPGREDLEAGGRGRDDLGAGDEAGDRDEEEAKQPHRETPAYLSLRHGPAGSASAPAETTETSGKLAQA